MTYEISDGATLPEYGFTASHKITITDGSTKFIYWYVKNDPKARSFIKNNDRDLVETMHEKGKSFNIGQFQSFAIGPDRSYHLLRLDRQQYVIKSLK